MSLKLEFPKKANSKRAKIFRNRARALLRPLAVSFYEKVDVNVRESTINQLTDAIIDDLIGLSKKHRKISSEVIAPDGKDEGQLLDQLYSRLEDVKKKQGINTLFNFVD